MYFNKDKHLKDLKVISIGDLNVDIMIKVDSLPSRGTDILSQVIKMTAGGTASNFAVGVSRLGVSCGLIAEIGSDEFTSFLQNGLKEEGVDTTHLIVNKNASNNKVVIIIDKGDIRTTITHLGSATELGQSQVSIDEEVIANSDLLEVSGVSFLIPSMRTIALKSMERAKKNNVAIAFDPNLRFIIDGLSEELLGYFRKAIALTDIFLPNEEEIKYLANSKSIDEASDRMLRLGTKIIALKRGSLGCKVVTSSSKKDYSAFNVEAIDVTGAGDAFDSAFIVGYLQGWNLDMIARFANAAGALTVTQIGAQAGLPYLLEVEAFLNNHKK